MIYVLEYGMWNDQVIIADVGAGILRSFAVCELRVLGLSLARFGSCSRVHRCRSRTGLVFRLIFDSTRWHGTFGVWTGLLLMLLYPPLGWLGSAATRCCVGVVSRSFRCCSGSFADRCQWPLLIAVAFARCVCPVRPKSLWLVSWPVQLVWHGAVCVFWALLVRITSSAQEVWCFPILPVSVLLASEHDRVEAQVLQRPEARVAHNVHKSAAA